MASPSKAISEREMEHLSMDASDPTSGHSAGREHPQLTREELERAFAHTLDDAQSEFQAEIVKTLQMRLELNSVKLRRYSSQLEAFAVEQGNYSVQLLKKQVAVPSSDLPGLTAACKVYAPRYDGKPSAEKRSDEESDYLAADGTLLRLVPKQVVKFDAVQNVPPYISWVFVQKNEYITEDLPVIGHQKIIYDERNCAVDSVKKGEVEEGTHFSKLDDAIITKMIERHGLGVEVLEELATIFHISGDEAKARYDAIQARNLGERHTESLVCNKACSSTGSSVSTSALPASPDNLAEKRTQAYEPDRSRSLVQGMDAFECLFCRRCLVFDCVLHGCSQELALPTEVARTWAPPDEERCKPCSDHCALVPAIPMASAGFKSCEEQEFRFESKDATSSPHRTGAEDDPVLKRNLCPGSDETESNICGDEIPTGAKQTLCTSNSDVWSVLETDLFEKALQIFGKNSCLISQTLLKGWKTCVEVSRFLSARDVLSEGGGATLHSSLDGKDQDVEGRAKGGGGRRKSRSGRKGTGTSMTNALRQRLSDLAKRDVYTNYNPCGCYPACGKDCPCKLNATCCEKICGCASSCKYRFRGCNCAKGHCSTRNCPCFAASRECDPDVCRRCWISCGDGSSLGPPQREDVCDCHNMSLFLGQKQRVLLGRSSIVGWGAFLKNPVEKNTFLGEYTGELITHDEAERRGRKYDHEGRSFLFNLNNEFCIDAYRKGDKLKFANHSSHPNCFAKIVLVSGDHRVGIFAKERISAGEELFYDYDYAPESCPDWAVKANEEELRQSKQYRANSKFAGDIQQPKKLKKKPAKRSSFSESLLLQF